jgi:hypothetical protein
MEVIKISGEFIRRWGADTISLWEKAERGKTSDLLCGTVLPVCSTYSNAIMLLLQNGWRMPAKALLRIVFEVIAKLCWCLSAPKTDRSEFAVEERANQWAKTSIAEEIKLREGVAKTASEAVKGENDRILQSLKAKPGLASCKPMPKFANIMDQPSQPLLQQLYVRLYLQFLNAVHLDCVSLGETVKNDERITDDSEEPVEYLAQCWVFDMYMLFFGIRSYYGWDTESMAKEFRAMKWPDKTRD